MGRANSPIRGAGHRDPQHGCIGRELRSTPAIQVASPASCLDLFRDTVPVSAANSRHVLAKRSIRSGDIVNDTPRTCVADSHSWIVMPIHSMRRPLLPFFQVIRTPRASQRITTIQNSLIRSGSLPPIVNNGSSTKHSRQSGSSFLTAEVSRINKAAVRPHTNGPDAMPPASTFALGR